MTKTKWGNETTTLEMSRADQAFKGDQKTTGAMMLEF